MNTNTPEQQAEAFYTPDSKDEQTGEAYRSIGQRGMIAGFACCIRERVEPLESELQQAAEAAAELADKANIAEVENANLRTLVQELGAYALNASDALWNTQNMSASPPLANAVIQEYAAHGEMLYKKYKSTAQQDGYMRPDVLEQTAKNVLLMEERGEWRMQGQVSGGFCAWSAPLRHDDVANYLKRGAMVCSMWGKVHPAYPERHPSRVRTEAEIPQGGTTEELQPQADGVITGTPKPNQPL